MKIYKLKAGILLESESSFRLLENENWDAFINDDDLFSKSKNRFATGVPINDGLDFLKNQLLAPIQSQEVWASGVTYFNSKLARQEESKSAGGGDFYARVYVADRPELFFKSPGYRCVGSGEDVRIRRDSIWNVPEPELTLLMSSSGKIVGYTIGNDMSSRSIEGENPLYLPQAKTYDGSAAIGPCIYVPEKPLPDSTLIHLEILRKGAAVFANEIALSEMKRKPDELADWLFRECSFPHGCFLMTGTGIIPPNDFTLEIADEIRISIEPIGTLVNRVGA